MTPLNPIRNDANAYIKVFWDLGENALFGQKNMFLACFEGLTHFSYSSRTDDNSLIEFLVIQLYTYSALCILSQRYEFLVFYVKLPIFHAT